MIDRSKLIEKTASEKEIFNGKIIRVTRKDVTLPNGNMGMREIVHHNGGVTILVVDGEYTYIVEQFRSPMENIIYELPAGKLEKGENPKEGALREVEEEVGLKANDLIELGWAYTSPGFCDEKIYFFACTDFSYSAQHLDNDEFLNLKRIKISRLEEMIMNGEIVDAKTICCLHKYLQFIRK